ncbi:hypothetical protein KIW84_060368 [Lathyrus oleraceus]|uniref:Retrovirus-related Pol polyprotein from transposon TNT 1-94-like beta-barrel domain-containing protein n=1 Tax=Pisum sativum TaxID=3888 RepID=A0A9D5A0W8_PEA|nr:hypothetical protein KIW84_060368 [Pisum sativum]
MSMANDYTLEIAGVGTVKLKMYDGTVCTIQEARHVKGLKKNLLSIRQLDDLRYGKHVEDDSFEAKQEHEAQEPEEPDGVEVRRSTRQKGKPNWQTDYVMESH